LKRNKILIASIRYSQVIRNYNNQADKVAGDTHQNTTINSLD